MLVGLFVGHAYYLLGQAGPSITSVTPASGPAGASITIAGTGFGATQGTSSVSFNGTAATPSSWSGTSIAVPVPNGAASGNIVVTVGGQTSNGVYFSVATLVAISVSPANFSLAAGNVTPFSATGRQ